MAPRREGGEGVCLKLLREVATGREWEVDPILMTCVLV